MATRDPMLLILSGLAGTGKTTIARSLARRLPAVHLRIDTIEHALETSTLGISSAEDAGYAAAFGVAEDNLRLGHAVIGDSVNPIDLTRDAWRAVAERSGCPSVDIEIVCSDRAAHRRRVESRVSDIAGFQVPTWAAVTARDYRPWRTPRIVVETAGRTVEACVDEIVAALDSGG